MHSKASEAADFLAARLTTIPTLAMVLGSGFQDPFETCHPLIEIPYSQIPGMLPPRVAGHQGVLRCSQSESGPVLTLSGRTHFYEGVAMTEVTFSVRMLHALGVKFLLLTNAAGAINPDFRPGDFIIIKDHINFMGQNPLQGWNDQAHSRFVDLSSVYDIGMQEVLALSLKKSGKKKSEGTYLAVSGPSYETPAEIRMFRRWGADLVGMSTVPEAIVARQLGMRVAALSCITNMASGLNRKPISHQEVLAAGRGNRERAGQILKAFARIFQAKNRE